MKTTENTLLLMAALGLSSTPLVAYAGELSLSATNAFTGDEIKIGNKVQDKNKIDITLENRNTKVRTHISGPAISSAGQNTVSFKIPANLTPGDYQISMVENGQAVAQSILTVGGKPQITGSNLQGVIAGSLLVINGKNFSAHPADNEVEFTTINERVDPLGGSRFYDGPAGTFKGLVLEATTTSLTVSTPAELARYTTSQVAAPARVMVKVNGVPANGELQVFIGTREWAPTTTAIEH